MIGWICYWIMNMSNMSQLVAFISRRINRSERAKRTSKTRMADKTTVVLRYPVLPVALLI